MSVLLSGGPIKIFRCVNPSFAPPADNFAKDWRHTQTDIPNSHQSFPKLQWLNHNDILHGDALACAQCHHDQTHRFLHNGVYMKGFIRDIWWNMVRVSPKTVLFSINKGAPGNVLQFSSGTPFISRYDINKHRDYGMDRWLHPRKTVGITMTS